MLSTLKFKTNKIIKIIPLQLASQKQGTKQNKNKTVDSTLKLLCEA